MRKTILLVLVIALCVPHLASGQLGRWGDEGDDQFFQDVDAGRFRPFIEGNYGQSQPKFKGLDGEFGQLGLLELKLGFASLDSVRSALVSMDERYVFGSYLADDVSTDPLSAGQIGSKLTRFGAGNRLGYGFGWDFIRFEMYNQNSLNWTSVEATNYDDISEDAQAVFDRYGSTLRFGQLFEAGLKIHVFRSLSLTAGAEGAVIFPRTVFWPWLGSAMIYSGVQGGLQYFAEEITRVSPVIGPILWFALKTAASAAFYYASREDMNWPFSSETPLTVESIKLGAAITF